MRLVIKAAVAERTAKIPTLTALNELLTKANFITKPITKSDCESYDKDTYAYVTVTNRAEVSRFLRLKGIPFNPDYSPKTNTMEIRVRYFRAKGLDE
jgi:hypothetical protein